MKWFGGIPSTTDIPHTDTPIGESCLWCDERIDEADVGLLIPHHSEFGSSEQPWHVECFARQICGGVNHLRKKCLCFGGDLVSDPPGMSRRDAAKLAFAEMKD